MIQVGKLVKWPIEAGVIELGVKGGVISSLSLNGLGKLKAVPIVFVSVVVYRVLRLTKPINADNFQRCACCAKKSLAQQAQRWKSPVMGDVRQ